MATPVGEENWLAYLEETTRNASDLEKRVNAVEIYKRSVIAEPGSLRLWLAYCNYFWSLWQASQSSDAGWSEEEQMMGHELFSFGVALDLWQQGYEAIKYRLNDSHELWDRWISLELGLLSKTKTPDGIKRISHLYRNRLLVPHLTWEETSQGYSTFLSEYNRPIWEESMKEATGNAQEVKRLIAARDPFEIKLQQAARAGNTDAQKTAMIDYIEWEMRQSKRNNDNPEIGLDLCRGLFARALTGLFSIDEAMWFEYVAYLSSSFSDVRHAEQLLDTLRCAVQHCPWSGQLWNRYILCAEEARLPFAEIESIKHSATSEDQLYKDGMESMIEMYVAWCGFLKRTAMDAETGDEAVDVADVGLAAALEDVSVVGKRLYGNDFQGDPKFRLERMYIQYLTEKKGAIEEARAQWNKLASHQIHADNHDFWLRFYMWEMLIFSSRPQSMRSPTPNTAAAGFKVPSLATAVLTRAVARSNIDWPEKVLEVFMQHCNDYEPPNAVRRATDRVHRTTKDIRKRREREEKQKQEAYSTYYAAQAAPTESISTETGNISEAKRKRTDFQADDEPEPESASKRQKNEEDVAEADDQTVQEHAPKRDRENTSVLVENLPLSVTVGKIRQYFKDYGHINITALVQDKSKFVSTALIEFKTPDEAESALLKNGKYFGESQLTVRSGHDLTVYVTNYPPAADESYIRTVFKGCGDILSIRWPSLKMNTHRRFCYVSFQDQDSSARAVARNGTQLEGRYRVVVAYSNPANKKKREGAVAEGREIHIAGLDKTADEEALKDIVSKYGTIKRVNIPKSLSGGNRGFAFVEFSTKGEAEKAAAELQNVKFRSQIMKVEVSAETKAKISSKTLGAERDSMQSPGSSHQGEEDATEANKPNDGQGRPSHDEISSRTIALMGLPDTVNDARVLALVEPFGKIVQMVLQPGHGGAKIEFSDAPAAGRAALGLNGRDFEGFELRTGSLDELRQAKPARKDQMPASSASKTGRPAGQITTQRLAPAMVRRPGSQRPGPRKGVVFLNTKKSAGAGSVDAQPQAEKDQNGPVRAKTNADFKAMLLGSAKSQGKDAHADDKS